MTEIAVNLRNACENRDKEILYVYTWTNWAYCYYLKAGVAR